MKFPSGNFDPIDRGADLHRIHTIRSRSIAKLATRVRAPSPQSTVGAYRKHMSRRCGRATDRDLSPLLRRQNLLNFARCNLGRNGAPDEQIAIGINHRTEVVADGHTVILRLRADLSGKKQ